MSSPSPRGRGRGLGPLPPALAAVLAAYLLLAVAYGLATPILEAGDENWHEPAVWTIATGHSLPVLNPADKGKVLVPRQEAGQPPLYYLLAAAMSFWVDAPSPASAVTTNFHADIGHPDRSGWNKNLIVHSSAEAFPWHALALVVHLQRLLSTLFGAVGVAAVYALARRAAPGSLAVAVLAAAFAAFNPMLLFVSAAVDNDALATALSTLVLVVVAGDLTRGEPTQPRGALLCGILLGLATLTKLSAAALTAPALAAYLWLAWQRRSFRQAVQSTLALAVPAALLSGWWFARNWALYGDPFGLREFLQIAGTRDQPLGLGGLLAEFSSVWTGFWGVFGIFDILLPAPYYLAADVLAALAGVGLLAGSLRWTWRRRAIRRDATPGAQASRRRTAPPPRWTPPMQQPGGAGASAKAGEREPAPALPAWGPRLSLAAASAEATSTNAEAPPITTDSAHSSHTQDPSDIEHAAAPAPLVSPPVLALLAGWLLLEVLLLARWTAQTEASSGRLLFPAIGSIAILLALGLTNLLPRLRMVVAALVSLLLAAGAALAIPLAILPAYAAPPFVAADQLHPATPLGYRYGNLELVGATLPPSPAAPGARTALTLYWRTLGPIEHDEAVSVQIHAPAVDGGKPFLVTQTDALPGGGKVQTTRWPAGQGLVETIPLTLSLAAPAPSLAHMAVLVYPVGHADQPIPPTSADGKPLPSPDIGRLELRAPALEPPRTASEISASGGHLFGSSIALLGADAPSQASAGGALTVTLRWYALAAPTASYTEFIHVVTTGDKPVAQQDQLPRAGAVPTTDWLAGQTVVDQVTAPIPPGTPPGRYPIHVGLYRQPGGERLPLATGGTELSVGEVTIDAGAGR